MQAQAQANAQQQQAAAQAEIQKNQAKVQADVMLEKQKNDLKTQYLRAEVLAKKELMEFEFDLNSRTKTMEREVSERNDNKKEDRKDLRVDRQAMHQKEMIEQRSGNDAIKRFESSGNDILTGGANMGKFSR